MADPVSGAGLKLGRAKHHIDDLTTQVEAFFDAHYAVLFKEKPDTSERSLFVEASKPIPDEFGLMIGDTIHNLRSALDHAIWAFVEPHKPSRPWKVQWPFGDDQNDLEGKIKDCFIPLAGKDVVRIVSDSRPYRGGDEYLFGLRELSNTDKHRVLTTTNGLTHMEDFDLRNYDPGAPDTQKYNNFGGIDIKNEDLISWPVKDPLKPALVSHNQKIDANFSIVFPLDQPLGYRGVIQSLTHMSRKVSWILGQFANLGPSNAQRWPAGHNS